MANTFRNAITRTDKHKIPDRERERMARRNLEKLERFENRMEMREFRN